MYDKWKTQTAFSMFDITIKRICMHSIIEANWMSKGVELRINLVTKRFASQFASVDVWKRNDLNYATSTADV